MNIRIFPPEEMIETEISLPLSKSMSNRALIMNALTPESKPLDKVALCDDTEVMKAALSDENSYNINIGAAGTAMRFLTAYFAAKPGHTVLLDGSERMRQRPIAPLVKALRDCGAHIEYAEKEGYPPLKIEGRQLTGGTMEIDATISSQFISALLMVAPTFSTPLTLTLKGEVASLPYLMMTIEMMKQRGVDIRKEYDNIFINPSQYVPTNQSNIERDWSAASYWYSIAALSAGWITLDDLCLPSLQGDSRIAQIFNKLGVITNSEDDNIELSASPEVYSKIEEDLSDCPDIVQTLVVTCCMLGIPFRFSGVSSLRIKETDRLEALKKEALKISCLLTIEGDDVIKWDGKRMPIMQIPEIDTYHDHRMAMAFAPASLYIAGLVINDAEVVTKSYPDFWDNMRHAGFTIVDAAAPIPQAD